MEKMPKLDLFLAAPLAGQENEGWKILKNLSFIFSSSTSSSSVCIADPKLAEADQDVTCTSALCLILRKSAQLSQCLWQKFRQSFLCTHALRGIILKIITYMIVGQQGYWLLISQYLSRSTINGRNFFQKSQNRCTILKYHLN